MSRIYIISGYVPYEYDHVIRVTSTLESAEAYVGHFLDDTFERREPEEGLIDHYSLRRDMGWTIEEFEVED